MAAGILQNSPQPIYLVISMLGVVPILWLGGKNVLGTGWALWSIASFSSFLSCFSKLAKKSSRAAKLFNAVQKAEVSWERIKSYLADENGGNNQNIEAEYAEPAKLVMKDAGFTYVGGARRNNRNHRKSRLRKKHVRKNLSELGRHTGI